tara:strand:+ start:1093 stop:1362 length:270 start_codon:yes stop_codon:yes gene_type:complete
MLTWEDCIGVIELNEDVVDAIAEHEHVPEIVALELANYLVHDADGVPRIKRMILDDIDNARARGDTAHLAHLRRTLQHFVAYARSCTDD